MCSSDSLFVHELQFIKRILVLNGYPGKLLREMEGYTSKWRHQLGMGPVIKLDHDRTKENIVYVKLPYCGPSSDKLAKTLCSYI